MTILFRADGNANIGMGHIMRCLSIADALRERGARCLFVTADTALDKLITKAGFDMRVLHSDYQNMDKELFAFVKIVRELQADAIMIDSYFVTEHYFRVLSEETHVVYIDDLIKQAYPVTTLINYNLFAEKRRYQELYEHEEKTCPRLLLGTNYAPLRKEFRGRCLHKQRDSIVDVLISTGGADREHVALQYLCHLLGSEAVKKYTFHFVLGAMNSDIDEIRRLSSGRENIKLHQNVKSMYELMLRCDVAIAASGSTLYELSASGVPIIAYVLADNQIELAQGFYERGAALFAGDVRRNKMFPDIFDYLLDVLDKDAGTCDAMRQVAHELVDGNGAERIADALLTG